MAETTSTLRARLQVEGADDLVRAFQTSSAASQKLETQLGKLGSKLSDVSEGFAELKAIALGGLATSKLVSEFSKFQKTLFDLNATSKITGQNFGEMKKAIDSLSESTTHSRDEIAGFYKQVSSGITGTKLTVTEFTRLTKVLSNEFGPSIEEVSEAFKGLSDAQNKNINVLKVLNTAMTDKQINRYVTAQRLLYGVSREVGETLFRTIKAHRDHGTVVDKEAEELKKFREQMQLLEKSFRNLVLEIGQPVAEALGNMSKHVKDAVVWFNDLIKSSDTLKAAFGWIPAVAAGIAGLVYSIKGLKTIMGIGSSVVNMATLLGGGGGGGSGTTKTKSSGSGSGSGGGMLGGFGKFAFVGDALKVFVVGGGGANSALNDYNQSVYGRTKPKNRGGKSAGAAYRRRQAMNSSRRGIGLGGIGGVGAALGGAAIIYGGDKLSESATARGHDRLGAGVSAASKIGGGIISGAGMGSMAGPWGALIGGIIGAGMGIVDSLKDIKTAISSEVERDPVVTNYTVGGPEADLSGRGGLNSMLSKEKESAESRASEDQIIGQMNDNKIIAEQTITAMGALSQETMAYGSNIKDAIGYIQIGVEAKKKEIEYIKTQLDAYKDVLKENSIQLDMAYKTGKSQQEIDVLLKDQADTLRLHNNLQGEYSKGRVEIVNSYKVQAGLLKQDTDTKGMIVDQLQSELDLANAMFMGMAPTLDLQYKMIDAIREQSSALDVEIAKAKENYINTNGSIDAKQTLIRLQIEKNKLTQKELDITKHLREGYLSAITAFTNVEGAFAKVIMTQDMGVDEMMNKFGARGAAGAGHKHGADQAAIQWNPDGSMKMGENQQQWQERYQKINNYNPLAIPSAARAGNDFQKSLMNQQLIGGSGTGAGVFTGPASPSGPNAVGGKTGITEAINDSILKDLVKGAQGPSGASGVSGVAGEVKKAKDEVQRVAIKAQSEMKKDTGAVEGSLQAKSDAYKAELKKQAEVIQQHFDKDNSWDKIAEEGGAFGTTIGARSKPGGKGGRGARGRGGMKNSDLKKENFRELAGVIAKIGQEGSTIGRSEAALKTLAAGGGGAAGMGPPRPASNMPAWVGKKNSDPEKFADLRARSNNNAFTTVNSTWNAHKDGLKDGVQADNTPAFTPISSIAPNYRPYGDFGRLRADGTREPGDYEKGISLPDQQKAARDADMFEMAKKRIGDDAFGSSFDPLRQVNGADEYKKFKGREERGDYAVIKASLDEKKWQEATESVFGKIEENQGKQLKVEEETGRAIEGATGSVPSSNPAANGGAYGLNAMNKPMATGGPIPGYGGGDRHPAMLEGGEFVLRKEAVKAMGVGNAFALNGMATGGLVGGAMPSPSMARSGGGGFNPRFAINVRGDSVRSIRSSVDKQLASILNDMMAGSGNGRSNDMNNNG